MRQNLTADYFSRKLNTMNIHPIGDDMSNYSTFPKLDHIYGYCACPIPLANAQITASLSHCYHIAVVQSDNCNSITDDCVLIVTYQMNLNELIDYIRQNPDQIISIKRVDVSGKDGGNDL